MVVTMTRESRLVRSLILPVGVLAIAGFALTACGGSSSSESSSAPAPAPSTSSAAPAPEPTTEPPAPNPQPDGDCSEEALNSAAANATGGSFGGVEEYTCDDGWAVVSGKMNDQYMSLLFKAEDGSWIPKESQEVCQSGVLPDDIAEVACA